MEVEPRHSGHHHDTGNVKYGYAVFGLSLLYSAVLVGANSIYTRKWESQQRPTPNSVWGRLRIIHPIWAHVLLWLILVVAISFFNVSDLAEKYPVVLKRFGRVGFSLVPLSIFLALRPAALGTSYLEYIPMHKWLLRVITAAISVHGIGYFVKWLIEGEFWAKTLKLLNLLGVIVFIFMLVLIVVSIRPVRRRFYRLFYVIHNATVLLLVGLTLFHARPGVGDFVLLCGIMLLWQGFQRIRCMFIAGDLEIIEKDSSSLKVLRFNKAQVYPTNWTPGSHVRLTFPLHNFRSWLFASHPYTLCSLPDDATLDLVVKKGHTFRVFSSLQYAISSPYSSLQLTFFSTAENVVILCGGSGISLGIPVIRYLQSSSVKSKLVWCVSNKADAFVLRETNVKSVVEVYVTGQVPYLTLSKTVSEEDYGLLDGGDQVELESLNHEQNPFEDDASERVLNEKADNEICAFRKGRPEFDAVFEPFNETEDPFNKWIIVCGPELLIKDAKKWGKQHGIQVFSEYYDM